MLESNMQLIYLLAACYFGKSLTVKKEKGD